MVLLCSVSDASYLTYFSDIEESLPENTPVCVRLTFNTSNLNHICDEINRVCESLGVTKWLDRYAYCSGNNIDIYWVKGFSWWAVILGSILALIVPPLIGAAIYALLPESWRNIIDTTMMLIVLGVVAYIFSKITVGMTGG